MKTVLLSAGHSGTDSGAVGNGYVEQKEALRIRDAVAAKLRVAGVAVTEDGSDGENEPLRRAIDLAKKADIAVEFHFNASTNPTATGIEVLAKAGKKKLSQSIAGAIANALGLKLRGGEGGWKADNSGQHPRLGFCEAGGLIVEVAFISNPGDMEKYVTNFPALVDGLANVIGSAAGVTDLTEATAKNLAKAEEINEGGKFHVVAPGDTLWAIHRTYGVDLDALRKWNKSIKNDSLEPGMKIKVHGKA